MFCPKFWSFATVLVYFAASSVSADKPPKGGMMPEALECLKEAGLTEEQLMEAQKSKKMDDIDPCFFGCFFKKVGFVNSEGMYDLEKTLAMNQELIKNPEVLAKLDKIKKDCVKVNDVKVSDGDKGCERSVLLFKCWIEHEQEVDISMED